MTKLEIITETVQHYTQGGARSLTEESNYCVYNGPKGSHCAVGRCMLTKYKRIKTNNVDWNEGTAAINLASRLTNGVSENLDSVLAIRYRGHEMLFWSQLQDFHDKGINWEEGKLTSMGELNVLHLIGKWGEG